jgi:hypothetical protein
VSFSPVPDGPAVVILSDAEAVWSLAAAGERRRIADFNLVRGPLNWRGLSAADGDGDGLADLYVGDRAAEGSGLWLSTGDGLVDAADRGVDAAAFVDWYGMIGSTPGGSGPVSAKGGRLPIRRWTHVALTHGG